MKEEICNGQSYERPSVSVCMAAYCGERYIAAQLQSILCQLAPEDEVIVVDDASTDRTGERVGALLDDRIRLIEHSRNLGVSHTFEDAIGRASGEIVFLSDQDDLWVADKVSTILQQFEDNPSVSLVVSDAALIDQNGAQVAKSFYELRGKFNDGILANLLRCKYHGCTMAFRAELLPRALPFPRSKLILHDQWLGMVNKLSGGKAQYIADPLVLYRRHDNNATGSGRLSIIRHVMLRVDLLLALVGFWVAYHFSGQRSSKSRMV